MARKPRIDQVGFYHVINRGVEKRDIYLDDKDRCRFLEIIDESATAGTAGSDPDNFLFLQTMLAGIWAEKVLECAFWG